MPSESLWQITVDSGKSDVLAGIEFIVQLGKRNDVRPENLLAVLGAQGIRPEAGEALHTLKFQSHEKSPLVRRLDPTSATNGFHLGNFQELRARFAHHAINVGRGDPVAQLA